MYRVLNFQIKKKKSHRVDKVIGWTVGRSLIHISSTRSVGDGGGGGGGGGWNIGGNISSLRSNLVRFDTIYYATSKINFL